MTEFPEKLLPNLAIQNAGGLSRHVISAIQQLTVGDLILGVTITLSYSLAGFAAIQALDSHLGVQRTSFIKKHAVKLFVVFTLLASWLLATWQDSIAQPSGWTFWCKTLIAVFVFAVLGLRTLWV